jgi:steroid delta-isomerase-like uncharacterized protein
MASKNVETLKRAHDAFNTRRMEDCVNEFADGGIYHDLPRGKDWSKAEFGDFLEGWVRAFSDSRIADANYIDAGDVVIAQFTARGINDGPLGVFPASNKSIELPYCEVVRFDKQGKVQEVTAYYDMLGMLSSLGHLQAARETGLGATPTP